MDYVLERFAEHAAIDQIIVVHPEQYQSQFSAIVEKYERSKPLRMVRGGPTRQSSTKAVLDAVRASGSVKMILHDAVRRFISSRIIDDCIAALDQADAVDVVIPTADTVVKLDYNEEIVEEVPLRRRLRRGQTPQGFWSHKLDAAYEGLTDADFASFSDDVGVLLYRDNNARCGHRRKREKRKDYNPDRLVFGRANPLLFAGGDELCLPGAVDGRKSSSGGHWILVRFG